MIRRKIFQLPCTLKAPKSFETVDCSRRKVGLTHLGLRIKRSCLSIYRELVDEEFSFQFSRDCMTPSRLDRVFNATEHLRAATSKSHQESFILRAAKKSLSTHTCFTDGSECFLKKIKSPNPLTETGPTEPNRPLKFGEETTIVDEKAISTYLS